MRKVAIMLCLLALSSVAVADEWEDLVKTIWNERSPGSPVAIQAAQIILQKFPPNAQMASDEHFETVYARAHAEVAYDLAERQRQYQEALRLTAAYRALFPQSLVKWAGAADALHLLYLLRNRPSAQEALQAAQACAERVRAGLAVHNWSKDVNTPQLLGYIVDLYRHAGQLAEGAKFLQDLPLSRPDLIYHVDCWQHLVKAYIALGQPEKAKQTALWVFRVCPFTKAWVNMGLKLLLSTLIATGDASEADAFVAYLKTGQGDNPFAQISMPQLTDEQLEKMFLNTGGEFPLLISAYLYVGWFDEALKAAQMEVVSVGDHAAEGVANIARCFKAKDMHLLRANQFLEWVKTGEGQNPLEDF